MLELTCKYLIKYSNWMSYKNGKWECGNSKEETGYYLVLSNYYGPTKDITEIDAIVRYFNLNLEDFKNMLMTQGAKVSSRNEFYFSTKKECETIVQAFELQHKFELAK